MAHSVDASEQHWQLKCTDLKQRGAYLLHTGLWSDCTFLVGPERVAVDAHRLTLASASPVFSTMFYGAMAANKSIPIPDIKPELFRSLLLCIYCDEIKIEEFENACELLAAAHLYMLPFVVRKCAEYISSNITVNNACRVYELARLYGETALMDDAFTVMSKKTSHVFRSDYFSNNADLNTYMEIFSLNELDVNSELDLLKVLEKYAANNNYTTKMLHGPEGLLIRKATQQIRFLTVTPKEFSEMETSILTESESLTILKNMCSTNTRTPMPDGFSTSREIRNRLRGNGLCRIAVGVRDSGTYNSDFFYAHGVGWRVLVDKHCKSGREKCMNIIVYSEPIKNLPCICIIEITIWNHNNRKKDLKILLDPIDCYSGQNVRTEKNIGLRGIGLSRNETVTLEVRVYTFSSLNEADHALLGALDSSESSLC